MSVISVSGAFWGHPTWLLALSVRCSLSGSQEKLIQVTSSGENYRAYLLRCWQEKQVEPSGLPTWRFTLVQVGTNRAAKGFASLENLTNYLQRELAASENAGLKGD